MDLFETATTEELLEEQKKATQAKEDYPALAELDDEVLLQLAMQNFKCSMCGESVLREPRPAYVVKWKEFTEAEYGIVSQENWEDEFLENCEIVMSLNEV